MDRLTSMGVFIKAADLGSFAAAAEALAMSPQMVAKHVVFLEDRLGTALLNRTTRRQSLTDVGRAYYDRCKLVLSEAEAAEALAHDMRSRPQGVLRVNAPMTFGAFTLAPFVTRYLTRYPEMRVDLTLNDRFVDPLEDGVEVMVRIGEIADTALIAHPLAPYRLIACAAPSYLAARGTPKGPGDLEAHDCLVYAYWSPSIPCPWVFTRDGQSHEVRANGRFRSNDWKALLHAATAGFGITLGPESVLAEEVAAGRLVRVLPDYQGPARPMHVLYPAGRRPTVKLRSFVDAVVEEFGPR
ncbi:LysR family transcriptional regulator [Rhodospirillum rubrum]|uniref:LysR substrate-binding domain-containing protein n=1 Tax=Rhodospirillum rubrum TaxID=1085 RepID=UPI001903DA22|nr:LysR substrate-binding domain-containing protein [Rhodospirillum rubrum]MBK1663378.1 LysR family transcriptional regulator [Rhodospirillum rubrum]MBK1675550.1 LysR family transcriptional regulator [Rhodospirillum rubrum]